MPTPRLPSRAEAPSPGSGAAPATHLALLLAYAHQDPTGRRALLDAAEAVAHGSDHPGLAVVAGRFLQLAR